MATKTKVGEYGSISILSRSDSPVLLLYFRDPQTGKQVYKSTGQKNLKDAKKFAAAVHQENARLAGSTPDDFEPTPLADAVTKAIQRSPSNNDRHRVNLGKAANYFLEWIEQAYPKIRYWHQVNAKHAEDYVDYLLKKPQKDGSEGVEYKTRKSYCSVLTMTAKYWNNVEPAHYHAFKIMHPALRKPKESPEKNYVMLPTLDLLVELSKRLEEDVARIGFALGGYCGLNNLEIVGRQPSDFDAKALTIFIYESKNDWRTRTIPIRKFVMDVVTEYLATREDQQWLVVKNDGSKAEDYTIYKCMRRVLDDALLLSSKEKEDVESFRRRRIIQALGKDADNFVARCREAKAELKAVVPKDMRKSMMNIATHAGCQEAWVEAYVGHVPKTVMGTNYVDRKNIALLKKNVVDKIFKKRA